MTKGTLLWKKTSHQVLFPSSFLDNERKLLGLLFKNFHRVCQNAFIPTVHSNNCVKKLPKILYFFYPSWKLNKLFRPAAETFSAVVEIAFYVCRGTCRGKFYCFGGIKVSYHFRTIIEHFPAFSQDIFVAIVKIAFHLSVGTIWGKQIRKKNLWLSLHFRTMSWKKIGPPSNILSKDRQNSNLPVQG